MVRIIDRRFDSKNKSAVNRQRFMRRFKGQIRKAVADAIDGRSIKDLDNGEDVSIPSRDLSEPQFHHGRGGVWETIFTGNDQFSSGDQINRPQGGAGGGSGKGKASKDGEGEDDFVFNLSREEFLDVFFDDLALPDLVKTQLARIHEYKSQRAGFSNDGTPANINVVRSLRGALGRHIDMRFTPDLRFRHDESFAAAERLNRLLNDPRVRADVYVSPFEDDDKDDGQA